MKSIYDKDKFRLSQDELRGEYIFSTEDRNFIYSSRNLHYLKQVSNDEFVIIDHLPAVNEYAFYYFKHDKNNELIYSKRFTEFDNPDDIIIKDTFILENKKTNVPNVYNCSTKNHFAMEGFKAIKTDIVDNNNVPYIMGIKTITEGETTDKLTMLINPDSLEADGFYSELQDRYIKIKENDGTTFDKDYNVRLVETLVEEVYPYLTILDKRRSIEKDEKSKVIKKVLISKLNDKSE